MFYVIRRWGNYPIIGCPIAPKSNPNTSLYLDQWLLYWSSLFFSLCFFCLVAFLCQYGASQGSGSSCEKHCLGLLNYYPDTLEALDQWRVAVFWSKMSHLLIKWRQYPPTEAPFWWTLWHFSCLVHFSCCFFVVPWIRHTYLNLSLIGTYL